MERVFVCVRARDGNDRVVETSGSTVKLEKTDYKMDRAFDWTTSQVDVYAALGKKVVDGITIGLNGTIFAYGQTGSGKTYTMVGPSQIDDFSTIQANDQGIIPRCIDDLFSFLKAKTDQLTKGEFQSEIHICYVQLYQEEWYDLLDGNVKLQFRTSTGLNAKRFKVTSTAEALELLSEGWNARKTAETKMNRASSRSHCVFLIELTTEELIGDLAERRTSKLHLVDLAGSERIAQTGVEVGSEQFKEGIAINISLTCLARVMRQLSEKKSVISYRDSKLTLFLKDSLGGKARTSIVVTVHSGKSYLTDIISSLQFARDCRTIENHLQVNMEITGNTVMALSNKVNNLNQQFQDAQLEYKAMLQNLQEENQELKQLTLKQSAEIDAWNLEYKAMLQKLQEENQELKQLTLKQSAEIDASKTKLCFEDERVALQTPKEFTKRRRRTIYLPSEEVRRSVQRARTLNFSDEEEVAAHMYIAEKNMFSFSQEENKENDLQIELNLHRQLIEEKNQEILALKDHANAIQAEAQMKVERLTKQLEEERRMTSWLERNNLEITKQNTNLIKENSSNNLLTGKFKDESVVEKIPNFKRKPCPTDVTPATTTSSNSNVFDDFEGSCDGKDAKVDKKAGRPKNAKKEKREKPKPAVELNGRKVPLAEETNEAHQTNKDEAEALGKAIEKRRQLKERYISRKRPPRPKVQKTKNEQETRKNLEEFQQQSQRALSHKMNAELCGSCDIVTKQVRPPIHKEDDHNGENMEINEESDNVVSATKWNLSARRSADPKEITIEDDDVWISDLHAPMNCTPKKIKTIDDKTLKTFQRSFAELSINEESEVDLTPTRRMNTSRNVPEEPEILPAGMDIECDKNESLVKQESSQSSELNDLFDDLVETPKKFNS